MPCLFPPRHPISYYKANKGPHLWRLVRQETSLFLLIIEPPLLCQVLTHYLLPAVVVAVATNVPRYLETIHNEGARHSNDTGPVFKVHLQNIQDVSNPV